MSMCGYNSSVFDRREKVTGDIQTHDDSEGIEAANSALADIGIAVSSF